MIDLTALQKDLNEAVEKYRITDIVALFSGGNDSITATHIASQHPLFRGCIHVNTKTSPVSEYASQEAERKMKAMGWQYITVSPFLTYRQIVAKNGHPGAAVHTMIYDYLKGRPITHAKKLWVAKLNGIELTPELIADEHGNLQMFTRKKNAHRFMFITGIRKHESQRRAKMPVSSWQNGVLWYSPVHEFTKADITTYIEQHQLPVGLSSRTLTGGECDCRCFAKPGENEAKEALFPIMRQYREKLEELARVSRELDLIEVQAGMRSPDNVITETQTKWGHGRGELIAVTPIASLPLFSICNDCSGQLDSAGNVGSDPDLDMALAVERRRGLVADASESA